METPSYILKNIKTPRLVFRKIKPEDADPWMEFFNSAEALRFLPFKQYSRDACNEWIERQELRYKTSRSGLCALIDRESGELVGQCGLLLQEINNRQEIEISYHLIPKNWKQGYAIEAAIAAKEYVFKNKLADSLISIIHIDNINSQKVAIRNGMRIERQMSWLGYPVYIFRVCNETV